MPINIPSKFTDIWTRLQVLLGLGLTGDTDFLTEVSNLIEEFYTRREKQTKQPYGNALVKTSTK